MNDYLFYALLSVIMLAASIGYVLLTRNNYD